MEFGQIDEKDIIRGLGVIDAGQAGIFGTAVRAGVDVNKRLAAEQTVDPRGLGRHDRRDGGQQGAQDRRLLSGGRN